MNSALRNQIPPPSTSQTDQLIPTTRLSLNARSLQILQQSVPELVQFAEMEAPDNDIVVGPLHEQTTPMEKAQQPETGIATTEQTDSWGGGGGHRTKTIYGMGWWCLSRTS